LAVGVLRTEGLIYSRLASAGDGARAVALPARASTSV